VREKGFQLYSILFVTQHKKILNFILTINVPLILKVRDIIFFCRQKVEAPSKNPKKRPSICFAPDKKKQFPGLSKSEVQYIVTFMSKRERERKREGGRARAIAKARAGLRARARVRAGKGKRKGQEKGQGQGKGKGQGKRERESTKALAILFLNCLGQSEKSTNNLKEQYGM
jgi:hypothetical protein